VLVEAPAAEGASGTNEPVCSGIEGFFDPAEDLFEILAIGSSNSFKHKVN
jgi:hypothetical protein